MTKKKKEVEPQVKAGVGVIVVKGQKVLIGERQGSHGAGLYAFPGGHIDPTDATLAHCGEREVLEETGMVCRVFSPDHYRQDLFTTYDILKKSTDGSAIYVTCYLIADYLHGGTLKKKGDEEMIEPLEPKKCKGWRWVSLDELAALVQSEDQRTWIPIHQVLFYLKQLWRRD